MLPGKYFMFMSPCDSTKSISISYTYVVQLNVCSTVSSGMTIQLGVFACARHANRVPLNQAATSDVYLDS